MADERTPDIVERLRAKQKRCKGNRLTETWMLCADAIAEIERLRASSLADEADPRSRNAQTEPKG